MRIEVLGFKQEELMKQGVSLDEALILRDIEDFINSGKTATYFCEEDGKVYHWILYDKILDDIPILGISKERLSRIINYNLSEKPEDYEEKYNCCSQATRKDMARRKYLGLLKGLVVKSVAEGTKSYFRFTDKFYDIREEIFLDTDTTFMSGASSQKSAIRHDKKVVAEGTKSYFRFTDKFYDIREEIFLDTDTTFMSGASSQKSAIRHDKKVGRGSQKSAIGYDKKVRRGSNKKVVSDTTKKCYQTRQKSETKDIYINIYIDIVEYLNEKANKNYKHNSDKTRRFIDKKCYQTRQKSETKDIYINIYIDIVEYLNEKANKNYKHNSDKTRRFIDARLNEGFTLEDFKKVIDSSTLTKKLIKTTSIILIRHVAL